MLRGIWRLVRLVLLSGLLVACTGGSGVGGPAPRPAPAGGGPPSSATEPVATATAPPVARQPLKVAYTAIAAAQAGLWIGLEGGHFAEQGIDLELLRLDGSGRAMPALISGDVPISILTGAAVAGAAAQGADLVFLASAASNLAFQIMVPQQVTSFEQLRGQPVGVSGLGSSSDFAMRTALRRFGLDPDRDVITRSIAGGDAQIMAALHNGAILAAAFAPPSDYHAEQQGFRSLARLAEWDVPYQGAGLVTTRTYLAANRDLVRRFLRGYVVAIHRMKTDPAFTLSVMRQYTGIDDERALEWGYKQYIEPMAPVPYATAAGLQGVIDSLAPTNPDVLKVDAAALIDSSLLQELETSEFIAGLYRS
jgi:ABC-type nitrate/sulfonate/bicarbonate transport system substrate-binding protein